MSAPPSKQLSANAPEFIPRVYTPNITNNLASQQGHYQQSSQQQGNQHHHVQQPPHHNHHHHHHQQHNHHTAAIGTHMRDVQHQMNNMRLTNNIVPSTHSVQDRLQINRGPQTHYQQPQHQHQHQHHHHHHQIHPPPHQYNNMHNQQFSVRNPGSSTSGGNYKHHQNLFNASQQQQRFASTDHLNHHRQSSHSSNINTSNQQQHQHLRHLQRQSFSPGADPNKQTEEESFAVNYVDSLINCLNENPGSFDTMTASVVNVFETFGNNEYILSNAMEMIFNRSIEEQNFRYMGAKLYGLLDLIDCREDSLFRMLLHMKLDYHRSEMLNYMQNEQSKVRGTTLFLAELYMQLRNDANRIHVIAGHIIFCIAQLLLKTSPENLKCICMTLKLAGYDLEIANPQEMSQIMQRLSSINNALDVSTSRILENVLNLQKNKWGRMQENSTTEQFNPPAEVRLSDEPVFYGPDGQIITEEESKWLGANIDGADSGSDLEVDSEMDAETRKAYKSFIREKLQNEQQ